MLIVYSKAVLPVSSCIGEGSGKNTCWFEAIKGTRVAGIYEKNYVAPTKSRAESHVSLQVLNPLLKQQEKLV